MNELDKYSKFYLSNYFSDLRNQVDLVYAQKQLDETKKKHKINRIWLKLIDIINKFELECFKNKSNLNDLNQEQIHNCLFFNKTIIFINKLNDFYSIENNKMITKKLIILNDHCLNKETIETINKK